MATQVATWEDSTKWALYRSDRMLVPRTVEIDQLNRKLSRYGLHAEDRKHVSAVHDSVRLVLTKGTVSVLAGLAGIGPALEIDGAPLEHLVLGGGSADGGSVEGHYFVTPEPQATPEGPPHHDSEQPPTVVILDIPGGPEPNWSATATFPCATIRRENVPGVDGAAPAAAVESKLHSLFGSAQRIDILLLCLSAFDDGTAGAGSGMTGSLNDFVHRGVHVVTPANSVPPTPAGAIANARNLASSLCQQPAALVKGQKGA